MADVEKDAESMHTHGEAARKASDVTQDQDGASVIRDDENDRSLGPNDETSWHYLTFETPLPSPAHLTSSTSPIGNRTPPPECPDLKKYTNPFLWPEKRKSAMTFLSVVATTFTAYTAGSYAPAISRYTEIWNISEPAAEVGITVFTCGFGVAPMFLAPFSELNGRRPVFVITGFLFVVFQMACAVAPSYAAMMVFRFVVGCMGSTFSTMVGGVVSDIYHAKDRNTAMALFSGGALFGTGLGPLVSGFIVEHTTWRWVFYLQIITNGAIWVYIFFFFYETRGSILLSKKAKTLNKWYDELEAAGYYGVMMPVTTDQSSCSEKPTQTSPQRIRWKVKADEERSSIAKMISISLYRPFHLLVTEPVVFFFSLWISFAWSVLYLTFSAIPLVYRTNHGFDIAETGAVFASISIATIISTIINVYQERVARRFLSAKRREFLSTPEGRLYFSCIQSVLLPVGLFWFGWVSRDHSSHLVNIFNVQRHLLTLHPPPQQTLFPSIHWIVPTLGLGCATMGILSIYLAVFNYLADIYHRYASSALAAQSFCRNMMAGAFPVFTAAMFRKMTFQGASSFLGGFAALLTIVPWILVFYGPKIRARSPIARELLTNGGA